MEDKFNVLVKGKFKLDNLQVKLNKDKFKLPNILEKKKEKIVEEKHKEALSKKQEFFEGVLVRLDKYNLDGKNLILSVRPTTWFDYVGSNRILNEIIFDNKTLREYFQEDLDINLANPITTTTIIITEDSKMIITKRSNRLYQYPGKFSASSSGFMDLSDVLDKNPNPFVTASREIKEEMGLKIPLRDFTFLGIGRSYQYMHFQILMESKIKMTSDEVKNKLKLNEEIEKVIFVDCDKKCFDDFLSKNPSSEWVQAGLQTVLFSLEE